MRLIVVTAFFLASFIYATPVTSQISAPIQIETTPLAGIWKGTEGVGGSWIKVSYFIGLKNNGVKSLEQGSANLSDLSDISIQGNKVHFVSNHQGVEARYDLKLNVMRLEGTGITQTGTYFFVILRRVTELDWLDDSMEKFCASTDAEYDANTFECYQGT